MRSILLVEDNIMFGRLTKSKIEKAFDIPVYWVKTLAETEKLLVANNGNFQMALLDFNLPDAPNGEVIDRVAAEGITCFVFTADITDEVRSQVWGKKVADYILKEDPNCLEYILAAMRQLEDNEHTLALVVGGSAEYRSMVSELLYIRKFRVINAADGKSALSILGQYQEVKLAIIDYQLPDMDGCELCQKVRNKYKHDRLAIIGFSDGGKSYIGARFIKSGANDYIVRESFLVEEFYCRVNHCLETIRLIDTIREGAIRDFLTGLYNRRYLFDAGSELVRQCQQKNQPLACVMADIDFFKKINDTYGHDAGDQVIRHVAQLMRFDCKEGDIVARIGGEEFCILVSGKTPEEVLTRAETLRVAIETTPVVLRVSQMSLSVTISMGACLTIGNDLQAMLRVADRNLYTAKRSGRNRVVA